MAARFLLDILVTGSLVSCAVGVSRRPANFVSPRSQDRQYAQAEQRLLDIEKEGFAVVIPGVANQERADLVARNIKWLRGQSLPFECWMYVYLSVEELPLNASDYEPCNIVRHEGFWMGHILALPLNTTRKPWVLHLMDSIEPQDSVNLKELTQIMLSNDLGMSSPTFDHSLGGVLHDYFPIMFRQTNKSIGRFVDYIELHFNVFSRNYFSCLQDNIAMDNLMGWGMAKLLASLCGGAQDPIVNAGRMGLIDKMTMKKWWGGSYDYADARKQMESYFHKHSEAQRTTYSTLGDLRPPEKSTAESMFMSAGA
eukprot:TRINITY_DN863_c1_g1_i1.p1 TRINITY_DN863_c1_g1~~TRINITY_DN863_c1_g1_i1.p1  ORF type:complete len:332 (-),score=37.47 TRINITY_DN863_c1_g1_i1:28-960(-)